MSGKPSKTRYRKRDELQPVCEVCGRVIRKPLTSDSVRSSSKVCTPCRGDAKRKAALKPAGCKICADPELANEQQRLCSQHETERLRLLNGTVPRR